MMTIGEVSKLTGVAESTLRYYDQIGLLSPARTGENVANNRRLYSDADIDRLEKIVILQEYGMELDEIREVLEQGFPAMQEILKEKVEALRFKANRLQNLILFAKLIDISGCDLFDGLACGPTDIDDLADAVRDSPQYREAVERLRSYTVEDLDEMMDELDGIIYGFMHLDEEEGFAGVERWLSLFAQWWEEHIGPLDAVGYLGFWAIFEDETVVAARAERIGGEEVSGSLQMFALYSCMKQLMLETGELVSTIADEVDSDVAAAADHLDDLLVLCGVRMMGAVVGDEEDEEVLAERLWASGDMALRYISGMLEDEELMAYVDPDGSVSVNQEQLDKVRKLFDAMTEDDSEGE